MVAQTPYGILHLARTPFTGVWSVIRNLALCQAGAGLPVAVGVLEYPRWTGQYGRALAELGKAGIATSTAPIPDLPYTALFPYLVARWRWTGNPWEPWISALCRQHNLSQCVVHCHNAWLSGAYVPYRGEKTIHTGFVATYHGIAGAPELRRSEWRRMIHRWLARRFVHFDGKLASVDTENTHVTEALFGIPAGAFQVIPNGMPEIFATQPAPFPVDVPTVGHIGTFNEGKGWRITADAVKLANARGTRCRFIAAGTGPEADDARTWCEDNASMATYLGYVENAGEVVTPHLTLFSLPSKSEGSPMAAIEALAAGVPVVGTGVSGLAQIIEHGRSGLLVERKTASVASALCDALSSSQRLAFLRLGARQVFAERFHIERCADAYSVLYHNALSQK